MKLRCSFILLLLSTWLPAFAAVPYTFTQGQPANADEVNANFSALVSQIEQLQAQVAALQPKTATDAIVGTWDFVSLDTAVFSASPSNINIHSSGGNGAVIFNTDGTFQINQTSTDNNIDVSNDTGTFQINCPDFCTTITKSLITSAATTNTQPKSGSGTYTVSGNNITLNDSGDITEATLSGDGKILVVHWSSVDGTGIAVAVKR